MKRTTVRRRSLLGLLAVLVTLLQFGSANPASADHGESRTVVNTIPPVSNFGQTVLLRATVYDISDSCDLLAITGCDRPTGRVGFYRSVNGTFPGIYLGFATHQWPTGVSDYSVFELSYCCLPVGAQVIQGVYTADSGGNHFEPSLGYADHRVEKAASATQLTQSTATTTAGQPVTFTASVTGAAGAAPPTGTVQFSDGPTPLGGPVALSGGSPAVTTSSLTPGSHSISAQYSGDGNYHPSGSNISHAVQPSPTTTALTSAPNPSTFGQSVLLQATVTGGATPTGTVTFKDGPNNLATVALAGGSAQLNVSSLIVGTHGLSAVYNGDATHAGSTSAVLTHTVQQVATSTALGSTPNPSFPDQAVSLQATVTPFGATGTLTFYDGATVLGTSALVGGTATLSTSALGVGSHSLTAVYNGDTTRASSTSPVRTHTVSRHPSATALTSDVNPTVANQPATFRASVTTTGTPTGTVTFKDGPTTLGTAPVVGGVATFTSSGLGAGSHSITAAYSGDATHAPSTSPALTQTVRACAITAAPAGQTTYGTAGNDVICGSAAADTIVGLGGDDVIVGFGGHDRISGGDGNDTVYGDAGDDQLLGDAGNDTLYGGDGVDRLMGDAGNDRLTGDAGSDYAIGAEGTDTCSAESLATCEDPDQA